MRVYFPTRNADKMGAPRLSFPARKRRVTRKLRTKISHRLFVLPVLSTSRSVTHGQNGAHFDFAQNVDETVRDMPPKLENSVGGERTEIEPARRRF